MTDPLSTPPTQPTLAGSRVAFIGKLAGMSKRQAQQLVRGRGGTVADTPDESTSLVVVGEHDSSLDAQSVAASLSPAAAEVLSQGLLTIVSESQFWQQLGLVDSQGEAQRWYTAAILAGLVGESVSTIRRWQRQGWLIPTQLISRLAYFDFEEVATARRIQELLAAGMSNAAIAKTLATLARQLPDVKRPLAELSIVVQDKQLLVRQESGLVELGGQLRFDFEATPEPGAGESPPGQGPMASILAFAPVAQAPRSAAELLEAAGQLELRGELRSAAEMYRAALVAGGPNSEICFLLAELLYQLNDLPAARERYYMAVELDEDYVEARANLGCVLAELGESELAVSAFEGALAFHDDYEDAHYHLARTLDSLCRTEEATLHWEAFLRLAPESPWADEAHERLGH